MVKKNVLRLLLILLIVSIMSDLSLGNPLSEYKKPATLELDMDIFSLLRLLEVNLPLTLQKVTDAGFELAKLEKGPRLGEYTASQVALNDGAVLKRIHLAMRDVESGRHMFFLFVVKNKTITRQELENHLGKFVLLPEECIANPNAVSYRKEIGGSNIYVLYTREPKNILINVAFSSIEPLEQ